MDYETLRKKVFSHLPKEITNKYSIQKFEVFIQFTSFDISDDTMVAFVRSINPDNENEWAYEVYVLHETNQPSLICWKISRVYSDVTKEMFNKIPL